MKYSFLKKQTNKTFNIEKNNEHCIRIKKLFVDFPL